MGIEISIDDFGTGYSSLSYLKQLPVDTLKIDRSFIKDIPEQQDDMEIVKAIVQMAKALKINIVAEGIETFEQLAYLNDISCPYIQGYLLSPPLPLNQLKAFLAQTKKKSLSLQLPEI